MLDLGDLTLRVDELITLRIEAATVASPPALGPACDALGALLRTAGIAALLVELDADKLHHMLIRSGLTRAFLLERTPLADRTTSRYCKISRSAGFFDAVAAGQLDLARHLIALGPQQRNALFEYEEDHAYVSFLYGLLLGRGGAEQKAILDGWSALLGGAKSAKLEVCRALSLGDPAVFDGAFARLLRARKKEIEEQERSLARDEMEYAGGRYLHVEGLALLRLAGSLGVSTRPEYDYCPREARQPMSAPFPNDLYPR
jgi:hypothetical protein